MSTLKVNTIQNTSGVEVYTAKAWVNFNGTGTVAIRAAGNVSSITDNGTGDFTVNFTTAMPDANYLLVGTPSSGSSASGTDSRRGLVLDDASASPTTTTARVRVVNNSLGALQDVNYVNVAIFR